MIVLPYYEYLSKTSATSIDVKTYGEVHESTEFDCQLSMMQCSRRVIFAFRLPQFLSYELSTFLHSFCCTNKLKTRYCVDILAKLCLVSSLSTARAASFSAGIVPRYVHRMS